MEFPADLRYTKEHEWARIDGTSVTVGITDYAQEELGDVVFVELPDTDAELEAAGTFGVVESVKAVSDLYVPLSGTVTAVNTQLEERPELVNTSPYGEGWMIVLEISNPAEIEDLLSAAEYQTYIQQEQS